MSRERDERGERRAITALDERTVRQIAAGEVVERPASVVKELVENAVDADASRVSVAVEGGGTDGVRVRDDGVGMSADELELAVEEHTTSKIGDLDDLEAGVATLGFRGEALYAIGAVSRLTVRSKPRGGNRGHELTVEGGEAGAVRPAGCPEGTTVEVADLFFNTPARRKFLKTDATEFDRVNTVVTQYALANPDVAVSLEHDGRELFSTEGSGDLRAAVLSVYGREVAESMVAVDADPGGAVERVRGLVSHPETTRADRSYLSTFVNDRYVTAADLRTAVLDAYGDQLAPDRYPFAVLFVDLPPDAVDPNVHPRKLEVRFDRASEVRSAVESAVERALLDAGLVRSGAPRGRSAPAETPVSPGSDDREAALSPGGDGSDAAGVSGESGATEDGADGRTAAGAAADERAAAGGDATANATPDPDETAGAGGAAEADGTVTGETESSDESTADRDWVVETGGPSVPEVSEEPPEVGDGEAESGVAGGGAAESSRCGGETGALDEAAVADETNADHGTAVDGPGASGDSDVADARASDAGGRRAGGVVGPTSQRTLDGEAATGERTYERLPPLRVLGQLHGTYVVAESPDGLVLVDQHAADERVHYERLRRAFDGDVATQALAEPVALELTAREAELFAEYDDALESVGFRAARTDERRVSVRAVPAVLDATLEPDLLRDVLTALVDGADGGETVGDVADDLLSDLACHPAVTGNTSLTEGSVVDLLDALDGCENPYACPHGRPVVVELDGDELGERFERDYPGHAGRRGE
jgi:DNA mismatch repair protein MutL